MAGGLGWGGRGAGGRWQGNNNNRIDRRNLIVFYSLLTAPRSVSSKYTQEAKAQSCANHVQHIRRSLNCVLNIVCNEVRRDSSALNNIYFKFILLGETIIR